MISVQRSLLSLGLASSLILSGCGGGGGSGDSRVSAGNPTRDQTEQEQFCTSSDTVFAVTGFSPVNGATGVALNTSVRITFNANVDPESVPGNVNLLIDGVNPVALSADSPKVVGKSVILTPLDDLEASTQYTIQALQGIRADCSAYTDVIKELDPDHEQSSVFTTTAADAPGDGTDTTAPIVTTANPENGESLAPRDTRIYVEFDEPIDPSSVTPDNFVVSRLDDEGNPVEEVSGVVNPVGTSIEFTPDSNLDGLTYYSISVGSGIRDLSGNATESESVFTFRTGGLVVTLNDKVVRSIPVLGDTVNSLAGALLAPLQFGEPEDGLDNLENALVLKVPLVDELADLAGGDSTVPGTTIIDGVEFKKFTSAAVAVCDPKAVTDAQVSDDCTLALDLGLNLAQLTALADAFTGGNLDQVPDLLTTLLEAITTGNLDILPDTLESLLQKGDGIGLTLRVVDDNGLPLPAPLENALTTVLDAAAKLPLVGDLLSQEDGKPLLAANLLEGELLRVDLGSLATIGILSGTETLIGENGILNLGGTLFDTLLALLPLNLDPANPGSGLLGLDSLPLLGDLIAILDLGNLLGDDGAGLSLGLINTLTSLLGLDQELLGNGNLPLLGNLLAILDLSNLGNGDLPLVGDLLNTILGNDGLLSNLPVAGQLLSTLNLNNLTEGDIPLVTGLLEILIGQDGVVANLPLVGDLLNQLLGTEGLLTNLPLVGDLLSALNLSNLTEDDIPLITGLLEQLIGQDGIVTNLPLVGDLLEQLLGSEGLVTNLPLVGNLLNQVLGEGGLRSLANLDGLPLVGGLVSGLLETLLG